LKHSTPAPPNIGEHLHEALLERAHGEKGLAQSVPHGVKFISGFAFQYDEL